MEGAVCVVVGKRFATGGLAGACCISCEGVGEFDTKPEKGGRNAAGSGWSVGVVEVAKVDASADCAAKGASGRRGSGGNRGGGVGMCNMTS